MGETAEVEQSRLMLLQNPALGARFFAPAEE
jgi:hypothetical protein